MTAEQMRDILMEIFPGRTICMNQDAWHQSHIPSSYSTYGCSIFKLENEPKASDGGTIVCREDGKDIRKVFIATCKAMFEYEDKLQNSNSPQGQK